MAPAITTTNLSLGAALLNTVDQLSGRHAIADSSGRRLTHAEVLSESLVISGWLLHSRPSETNIGVLLPPGIPAALLNYGVTLAGKTVVNLNFTTGMNNCLAAINTCNIQTVLTSRTFIEKLGISALASFVFLEEIPRDHSRHEDPGVHDNACVLFSSGSTGTPKGIPLTHRQIAANAAGLAARIPPTAEDCVLGVLPFFHSFGYTFALWFPVLHGLRAVYHSNPTDARTIGELAQSHRATYLLSTPTFCSQYAKRIPAEQFASLRYILVGAEKLRDSVSREFRSHFGTDLLAGYGCTELGPGVAINTPSESKPGSVGKPLEGISIRIVDPDTFEELPTGRQGIITVNGPSRMHGYYNAPQLTAEAIRDGYYITGDLGYMDQDGYLYIADRLARFSKIGGEMVPHLKIEEAVCDLTAAFVTGVPDDRRGERLVLLYTNPAVDPNQLVEHLQSRNFPPLWIPKRDDIRLVNEIPLLANGKVDLQRSRALAAAL